MAELDSFVIASKIQVGSATSSRTPGFVVARPTISTPTDSFRPASQHNQTADGGIESLLRKPLATAPLAPEPKAELPEPQRDWTAATPSLGTQKKSEDLTMGEWLFADSGRRQPEKSGDPNLALQESLLASLNLPGPLPQIQAATTPIQADADASLKKLDALPAGYFSPGLLREACKTPQSAAALVEKQNTALTSREGRAQYASFLESARDDAELGKLYSLVHQSLSPEQEAEHLKLVAKDPQVSAAQLGVVDAGLFKKAASNPLLGTALAEVQASALKTESGVNALLTLTQAASATPEGAADLYASRASAAQSEPGRKALEGLYAGIASQAKLVQAQASLEVQALTTEPGRQAVVMERTQAAQSPQLCAQLVRLESKTQSLPQSNQIATAISNQSELAGASLAVSAAAAQTPAGLSQLAEVFQKVAQDPQKASLWAKTQSLALQNPAGQADFIQLHKNLRQDKTAATAYTNALTAAGVEELTGLLGAAARNPQTSSLLLSTANQAPTCSVQELVIKSSASPTEMGNLLSSALEAEGGVSQIGKLMQAVSESPAASSAAIRALNAGPTQSLVIKLAENAPAAAATTAALATATQSREGRTEVAQLLAKTSKDEGLSQATLHLLNAGKPEDVRTFLTGASLEPKAAAELGKTMVVASRKSEGVEEVTKLLQVASATPEAARSAVVVLNAPGTESSREITLNLSRQPESAASLGTLMTTASRTPEGTSEVSRWLEACSATSEAARSAVVVLNAPGPERARELVGHLGASGPGLVGLLSRATQTPEGQAQTANLLQITAEKPESAKALVLALSQAGTEKAAAFFAQVAEPEPLGQNLRQAAAEPEGARLVKKMIAEVSAAPEAAKAIQTALASSEASARVRQSSPIKPQTAPDSASTEPPWAKQDPARESLTKAPPQVEVELLTQSASSPAAAAELLNHLSQAKAGPALSRFLARATQDAESSNALLGVLQQAEPPEGLARTLSHPETGQAVIKAASLARPATVSSLTERISQGQLASAAFVKVVAQAPLESLRGMLTNVAGDAGASSSFVKALCQAPPAAVQVLLTRVVGDQEACEAMVQALTVAAATPDGKAAVLSLKSALAAVMTAASPESTQELRKLLDEATPSADKKASATGDKASAAGSLVVPATTHGAASITRVSKAMEGSGSPLKLEIGHSLHKQGLGRYQEGERISGHHRVNVLVGGSKTIKQNEESEESLGVEEVKKAERHRNAQSAAPIEEIQAIQLFERGQRRGQSCSRCGSQFEGRVASCPNCQGEMLELLAVNSVNYRRAGFLISTQTDLVEVTVAARDFLDTDQSSIAGMRSPQRFVTLRDLLANCQQTVAGYATVTKTRTRRPKFD